MKAIVDLAHLSRTYWHASEHLPLSTMLEKSMDALWKVAGGANRYDALYCAIDSPPYDRVKIYPEYKANRDGAGPVYEEEYRRLQERARGIGFAVLSSPGQEADDVIATAVSSDECEWDIYTNDKDLLQLVSSRVRVVSTVDFTVRTIDTVIEKFGIQPNMLGDWLALVGDNADNIPGCPKIGAKTATKIIAGTGGLANMWSVLDAGLLPVGANTTLAQTILANREQITMSRRLVELQRSVEIHEKPNKKEEPKSMTEPTFSDTDFNEARGPEPEPVPEQLPVPTTERHKQIASIAKSDFRDDAIELRPGVFLTSAKYALMKQLAGNFHDGGLYSKKFGSAQAVFTVMMMGLELGISPQVACQNFHIIEGKPSPSAHFLIALAKRDPDCLYLEMVEETAEGATYATKKRSFDRELRFTYTVSDARSDGARWANSNSKNHRAMLRKTAGCQAARLWYPAACSGLYSQEELGYELEEQVV